MIVALWRSLLDRSSSRVSFGDVHYRKLKTSFVIILGKLLYKMTSSNDFIFQGLAGKSKLGTAPTDRTNQIVTSGL